MPKIASKFFDGRLGTLHVAKNSSILGHVQGMVQQKLKDGVAGDSDGAGLCWAVSTSDVGWAIRVERMSRCVCARRSWAPNDEADRSDGEDDIC